MVKDNIFDKTATYFISVFQFLQQKGIKYRLFQHFYRYFYIKSALLSLHRVFFDKCMCVFVNAPYIHLNYKLIGTSESWDETGCLEKQTNFRAAASIDL